jgi:WD40 repeat protein
MILAVGPGTPASVVMTPSVSAAQASSSSSSSASSSSRSEDVAASDEDNDGSDEGHGMEEEDSDVEEEEESRPEGRNRWVSGNQNQNDDSSDSSTSAQRVVESTLLDWYASGSDSEPDGGPAMGNNAMKAPAPSMRHGGCINTAAWMDCGWRISTAGHAAEAVPSEDCPTQLVTSGDDHLVKFWDVREGLGSTTPLSGGFSTLCPFSAPKCRDREGAHKWWKDHYAKTKTQKIAGTVLPLATLQTGHRGNVFHVTPITGKPGKVATCGADGYLRVADLETGDSSVIVSPEFEDDLGGLLPAGLLSLRAGMCFSHHFLNKNTGLLCSERGLRRFDLRLPPREQPTRSLLGGRFRACKACAIWSSPESASSLEEGDSIYVFGTFYFVVSEVTKSCSI